jgi:hypothetical protein
MNNQRFSIGRMASIDTSSTVCREKEEGEDPDRRRRISDFFLTPIAFNDEVPNKKNTV